MDRENRAARHCVGHGTCSSLQHQVGGLGVRKASAVGDCTRHDECQLAASIYSLVNVTAAVCVSIPPRAHKSSSDSNVSGAIASPCWSAWTNPCSTSPPSFSRLASHRNQLDLSWSTFRMQWMRAFMALYRQGRALKRDGIFFILR